MLTKEDTEPLTEVIVSAIKAAIAPLKERIAQLEQRQANFKYIGPWQADTEYQPGNFVTHSGSVWHCNLKSTACRPGDGVMWTLAVKAGKDAR